MNLSVYYTSYAHVRGVGSCLGPTLSGCDVRRLSDHKDKMLATICIRRLAASLRELFSVKDNLS